MQLGCACRRALSCSSGAASRPAPAPFDGFPERPAAARLGDDAPGVLCSIDCGCATSWYGGQPGSRRPSGLVSEAAARLERPERAPPQRLEDPLRGRDAGARNERRRAPRRPATRNCFRLLAPRPERSAIRERGMLVPPTQAGASRACVPCDRDHALWRQHTPLPSRRGPRTTARRPWSPSGKPPTTGRPRLLAWLGGCA